MFVIVALGYENGAIDDVFGPYSTEAKAEAALTAVYPERFCPWGGYVMPVKDPPLGVPALPPRTRRDEVEEANEKYLKGLS